MLPAGLLIRYSNYAVWTSSERKKLNWGVGISLRARADEVLAHVTKQGLTISLQQNIGSYEMWMNST